MEIIIDTVEPVGGGVYTQFGYYYRHKEYGFGMVNALVAVQDQFLIFKIKKAILKS